MRPAICSNLTKYGLAVLVSCGLATILIVEAPAAMFPPQDPAPAKKPAATAKKKGAPAAAPAPSTDPKAAKSAKPSKAATPKGPAPVDPFWDQPAMLKKWDLDALTSADEARIGADLDQAIRHTHPPLENGPLPRRLESAAEPYPKVGSRKEVNYTVTVLDCEGSNVFSGPGGYIYVCRGTFDWIDDEEDYVLEFMILHEMAHIDLFHQITNLRDPEAKKLPIGTVPMFYSIAIPWGNTEAQEYEADRWALEKMRKMDRSPYQIQAFLRKLEDYSKKNGFENYPRKPMDKPEVALLDNHIRAHPVPYKRLRALKALMNPTQKARAEAK